ncbi:LacI family DNA-binding transcriptional regulator [Ectobacillus ponti]|uniref:Catabolite control protein A n=1 Tax=Ectobacillus ponti TaxID=2961894 RepID=A0AA42BR24_9BACI|nr:LacI family DNA-binding transcriptional regulator [Ectobacillus ponti]MCP8966973.1 LacI family transcriptional regulator [Ectobacillus ponti]
MATIRDVAKLAGVSVATVSRVLNKKGYVHEDTVKQVEQAIEQLHYKPNAVAKSLFKKSSTMIALLVTDFQEPSFLPILTAVEQAACREGYQTIVCNITHDISYLDTLLQNHTAGYILSRSAFRLAGNRLAEAPYVVIDGDSGHAVQSDEYGSARQAVEWLLSRQAKFLACVYEEENSTALEERVSGVCNTAEANGLSYRLVPAGAGQSEQVTAALLAAAPYIDSVVACNEGATAGVLRAARGRGLAVPEQLHVIALHQSADCPSSAASGRQKGEAAARMLLKRLTTGQAPSYTSSLPPQLTHS